MTFKRGYIREDGMVFDGYQKYKDRRYENWVTPARFAAKKKAENERSKVRYAANRDAYRRRYQENKAEILEYQKQWRARNPDKIRAHTEKLNAALRAAPADDPRRLVARRAAANWARNNPDKVKAKSDAHRARKKATGVIRTSMQRLCASCRSRIRNVLHLKTRSTPDYLGCSWEELIRHLEAQFKDGMTWENYGFHGWHVDHITPLASASTEDELLPLFHFSNLQPLWAAENFSKKDRIIS